MKDLYQQIYMFQMENLDGCYGYHAKEFVIDHYIMVMKKLNLWHMDH